MKYSTAYLDGSRRRVELPQAKWVVDTQVDPDGTVARQTWYAVRPAKRGAAGKKAPARRASRA